MPQISATHLSRHLSEILDGVEHRGESYTVVRHGRAVAKLEAARARTGAAAKRSLERITPDPEFADAVQEIHDWANRMPARLRDPWAE